MSAFLEAEETLSWHGSCADVRLLSQLGACTWSLSGPGSLHLLRGMPLIHHERDILRAAEVKKSVTGTGASPWRNPHKVPIKWQCDGHLSSGPHLSSLSLSVTPATTLLLSCKLSSARDQAFRKCKYKMNQSSQTGGCHVHREAAYRSHRHPQNPSAHCSWSREIARNKGNCPAFPTVLGYIQT